MKRTRRPSGRTRIIVGLSFAATLTMALAYGQVLQAPDASAATISCSVTDSGDGIGGANKTLRDCIIEVSDNADGGTVIFSGVTTVTLETALPEIAASLTLDGGSGTAVQIRRTTDGTPTFGFLKTASGLSGVSLDIRNLDIRGFTGMTSGQGIIRTELFSDTLVSIADSTIASNSGSGRLIDTRNGITVTGSTFSNNTSNEGGGAIRAHDGTMTITDSTFSGNRSTGGNNGGAVFKGRRGDVFITRTTFENNQTEFGGRGGGIYLEDPDAVNIVDSAFVNNVGRTGGGVFYDNGFEALIISGTRFESNVADGGGGLWLQFTPAPGVISNSTFVGNAANETGCCPDGGGAISWRSGQPLTVNNSYFGGNTSNDSGAAIRADYNETDLTLNFTTIVGNTSAEGMGDVHSDGDAQVFNGSALSSSGLVCQLDDDGAVTSLYTVTSDSSCGLAGDTGSVEGVSDFGLAPETSSVVNGVSHTYRIPQSGSILLTGAPSSSSLPSGFPSINADQLSASARSSVKRLTIGSIQVPEPSAPGLTPELPAPIPTSIPAGEGTMPFMPIALAILVAVGSGALVAQRGRRGLPTDV